METSLSAWIALATLVTITPGPDTLLVAGHAMKSGARAGFAATSGIISGFFWYAALAAFGFMALLTASATVYFLVKAAGAIYLVWIGATMLMGALRPNTQAAKTPSLGAPFRQGFLSNALNPKVALFYLAVLPQFIGVGADAPVRAVLLIAIHYLTGAIWLTGIALMAARAGAAVRSTSVYRWIEGIIGAALAGLGARLLADERA